ncbi:MAG: phosphoribosylformylglycinamidine synthase subunit PurL [Thaumarchaeota archaeon]|nr:phosphoribosylformylglycinamidine synthase subunit PurL [Nitrososphaerota archaeon]
MSLLVQEKEFLQKKIGRKANPTELQIVAAQWSEHCSYKSSKMHLKMLPKQGKKVISEKGLDSGVLDVGNGYVVTVHIESHNHPSAVDPYGGAATGVGGIIRDILSAGTRPIAILDSLRFGNISKDPYAKWLFKNAVRGIADYGNCLGIPTIGGEVEFDNCYKKYALVDVAAIGFGKKNILIKNNAAKGDLVVLIGGLTGRDGIGGSQFASDILQEENRSAVQIPDPFIEKLIIEAILEARNQNCIKAMKDLGGGGLACAISETADTLSVGIQVDVSKIHKREDGLSPAELMTSESQERILVITDKKKIIMLKKICKKFGVPCSVIGHVKKDKMIQVTDNKNKVALLPANVVANAPLLDRHASIPKYLKKIQKEPKIKSPQNLTKILLRMLSNPNLASKTWVYSQYDHEVGIRTVVKPGHDAAVLRLDNKKFLALKIDGNPKHCYVDPKQGAIGCFEEACRNVVCTGATPIGMIDHLQFGNPEDPEIFWTFKKSLEGISDYAKHLKIPCVGGKVSFYNETDNGPIKPTPIIGVLGLIDHAPLVSQKIMKNDLLLIVGQTKNELGGSEYYEYIHGVVGGTCPSVDFIASKLNMKSVLTCIKRGLVNASHDCSNGGLAVAVSELCIKNKIGCSVSIDKIPCKSLALDRILFSESHSRYLLVVAKKNLNTVCNLLSKNNVQFGVIGTFNGSDITFRKKEKIVVNLSVDKGRKNWLRSLEALVSNG